MRKTPLSNGETYHIFSKSIAGFEIFRSDLEYSRMIDLIRYYKTLNPPLRFSAFAEIKDAGSFFQRHMTDKENMVEVIGYCIMPTHIHLILHQVEDNGISIFMKKILDSYSKYFNLKTKRKGPLWESKFKNVLVSNDDQLLHLTRYIHLNPVTAYLTEQPQDWKFSSYNEFLENTGETENICNTTGFLEIEPKVYKEFTLDQVDYQRQIKQMQHLILE